MSTLFLFGLTHFTLLSIFDLERSGLPLRNSIPMYLWFMDPFLLDLPDAKAFLVPPLVLQESGPFFRLSRSRDSPLPLPPNPWDTSPLPLCFPPPE